MSDKTTIISPLAAKKRLRRGAEGRRIEEIEKIRIAINAQGARGIIRRPTRVLPDVPGFTTLNKNDYKRDHKDITKHTGVSSIFFDTDTESEDEQGFNSILGSSSLLVRSQYPPVAAQSSIAKKKRRYASWVYNSSAIQNDLSTYKSTIEQVQQQLQKVEEDEVIWAESFELTRRQLISSITDIRTAIRQSDQDAQLLYDMCLQEGGLSRKRKFPFMSDILGALDDSQRDILEGIEEYYSVIASASMATTTNNGYDFLPVVNMVVDELDYVGDKDSIYLQGGGGTLTSSINKKKVEDNSAVASPPPSTTTTTTTYPNSSFAITAPAMMTDDPININMNNTRTTYPTSTDTTIVENSTSGITTTKHTRMRTRQQQQEDNFMEDLSSYFTSIESVIKARTLRLVDLDPFLTTVVTTSAGANAGTTSTGANIMTTNEITKDEQEDISSAITTTTLVRPTSIPDKSKIVTSLSLSNTNTAEADKQLKQQQQFTKQLLEFRQSDVNWAKVLHDICTPATDVTGTATGGASRPKRRGGSSNGGGSQQQSKRIVTISTYPMHWAPKGLPLLLSPLSLMHDKVVGAMYSYPASQTSSALNTTTAATVGQIHHNLSNPLLLFQSLSTVLRNDEADQSRVNDLHAHLLRLQNQIKRMQSSTLEWEKRAVDSFTALHRAESAYSQILYEDYQEAKKSSKEILDYDVTSWNTAAAVTTESGWDGTVNTSGIDNATFPTTSHTSSGPASRSSKARTGGAGGAISSKRSNKGSSVRQQQYFTTNSNNNCHSVSTSVVALGDLPNDLAIKALQQGGRGAGGGGSGSGVAGRESAADNDADNDNDVDGANDMSIASSVSSLNDTYDRNNNMSYPGGGGGGAGGNRTKPKRVIGVRTNNKKTARRAY